MVRAFLPCAVPEPVLTSVPNGGGFYAGALMLRKPQTWEQHCLILQNEAKSGVIAPPSRYDHRTWPKGMISRNRKTASCAQAKTHFRPRDICPSVLAPTSAREARILAAKRLGTLFESIEWAKYRAEHFSQNGTNDHKQDLIEKSGRNPCRQTLGNSNWTLQGRQRSGTSSPTSKEKKAFAQC